MQLIRSQKPGLSLVTVPLRMSAGRVRACVCVKGWTETGSVATERPQDTPPPPCRLCWRDYQHVVVVAGVAWFEAGRGWEDLKYPGSEVAAHVLIIIIVSVILLLSLAVADSGHKCLLGPSPSVAVVTLHQSKGICMQVTCFFKVSPERLY